MIDYKEVCQCTECRAARGEIKIIGGTVIIEDSPELGIAEINFDDEVELGRS